MYSWEMETNQNEVTTIFFRHDTGFSRFQNKIVATLEMDQVGDPSLFNKVLPAVIADKQALFSAQNLDKPKLEANKNIGYNNLELYAYSGNSQQVSKINWEFDKEDITKDSLVLYNKLYNYPEWLIKALYTFQHTILAVLSP